MPSYIGIDLGTTFSAVSTIDNTGRPKIIENEDGHNITASCVSINGDKLIVGEQARRALQLPPHNAVGRFKREMGTDKTYDLDGNKYTPTDLSAVVLKEMKKVAEKSVNEISECVVTVPANFAHRAREATMDAAQKAGLEVKYIIDEPTAAALYYAYNQKDNLSGYYAVYDLGGGTFDVSIIKISSGQNIDVIASNGVSKLGGDDFDKKLFELVSRKYKEDTGNDLDEQDYTYNEAEEDKKSLSTNKRTIAGGGAGINGNVIQLKQEEFESEISALITQTEMLCEATLQEAKLKPKDIKSVFLAGGSTRIPCVLKSVERVFEQFPVSTVNVDEVVALGASLYAAYMSDGKDLTDIQEESIKKIQIKEATSKCFGTAVIETNENTTNQEKVNLIIIHKNEKIPCEKEDIVYTMHDNQTVVTCEVTSSVSAERDLSYVDIVHEGKLDLPPNRPAGQEIKVKYSYDVNQIMHCLFTDVNSGAIHEVSLKSDSDGDETSEIDKFLVD